MGWAPAYTTLDALKAYLTSTDQAAAYDYDDDQLTLDIEAASRAIDDHARRQFGLVDMAEPRLYSATSFLGRYVVRIDDLMTDDGLVIELDTAGDGTYSTSVDVTKVSLAPLNAEPKGRPWDRIVFPYTTFGPWAYGAVRVTAQWGWTSVPDTIEQACLMQAARLFKRRNAVFGVIDSPADTGLGMRLSSGLDRDVQLLVNAYAVKTAWSA